MTLFDRTTKYLTTGDVFTYDDVIMDRLSVSVLSHVIPSDLPKLEDSITLKAVVKGRYNSAAASLNLTYIPDVKAIKVRCAFVTCFPNNGNKMAIGARAPGFDSRAGQVWYNQCHHRSSTADYSTEYYSLNVGCR